MGTAEALLTLSAQDKPRIGPALPRNLLEQDAEAAGKGGKGPSGKSQGLPGSSQGPVCGCRSLRRPGGS